jgi:hypothetical protein
MKLLLSLTLCIVGLAQEPTPPVTNLMNSAELDIYMSNHWFNVVPTNQAQADMRDEVIYTLLRKKADVKWIASVERTADELEALTKTLTVDHAEAWYSNRLHSNDYSLIHQRDLQLSPVITEPSRPYTDYLILTSACILSFLLGIIFSCWLAGVAVERKP